MFELGIDVLRMANSMLSCDKKLPVIFHLLKTQKLFLIWAKTKQQKAKVGPEWYTCENMSWVSSANDMTTVQVEASVFVDYS